MFSVLFLLNSVWAQPPAEVEAQDSIYGGVYVLYSGFEPGVAIDQASAAAKRPASDFSAVTLRELRETTPPSLSGSHGGSPHQLQGAGRPLAGGWADQWQSMGEH